MDKMVGELEGAANILMAPPNAVSNEERQKAEQYLIEFRKTRNPYDVCKTILETCKNDYVLFEAVTTIKLAIIREWSLLTKDVIDSICNFLLTSATSNTSLQNYVREQILQVVAIIFKLGTLEDTEARAKLIAQMSQLLNGGNKTMELISCSIMKALLTEFSTTNQSTNFGLSLDFHSKCKRSFEEKDLLNIFVLTIQILQKYITASLPGLARQDIAIFVRYLSLAEQILHWEFMTDTSWVVLARFNLTCSLNNETAKKIIFRPPKSWRNIVLDSNVLDLFFKLLQITLTHSELNHHSMQCLTQLASLAGRIYPSDEVQAKYVTEYIERFLKSITHHNWSGHQALGISNMIYRLVDVFPVKIIKQVSQQTLSSFLDAITYFTCSFQELAVHNVQDLDDNEYSEATNQLLDAWMVLVSHSEEFADGIFTTHASQIVEMYLKTHLSPPDGIMKSIKDDEVEYGENTENDRDLYSDELKNVCQLGRQCLMHLLPVLNEKLDARIMLLKQLFIAQKEGKVISNTDQIDTLFEDLHWLILISSYLMSDDNPGESPQIPSEVITYTNSHLRTHPQCIATSVKFLSTIGKDVDARQVDPIVYLFTNILRIVEIEMEYLRNQAMLSFSPELASSLLWYLKRFVCGYLSLNKSTHLELSPTLTACFDIKNECGKFVLKLLLDIVEINICSWAGEALTSEDTVKLLLRLVEDKERAAASLSFPTIWSISKMFTSNHPAITSLSPKTQRHLAQALMRACDKVSDVNTKKELQKVLLDPILLSYQNIRSKPNFHKICQEASIKQELIRVLDCITGIAPACFKESATVVFQYITPLLEDSVNLLKFYDNDQCMVVCVLEMFVVIVDEWLCSLETVHSAALCRICLALIQNYNKFNCGKLKLGKFDEEDQYEDILLLIKLLSHILARDFLSTDDDSDVCKFDVNDISTQPVECVIVGLHSIIPLIDQELMKYPKLSGEYFKLVTFVCEVYPEKMKMLPPDIFQTFMTSIQMAISEYGGNISKNGLEALSSLAKYYCNECDHKDTSNLSLFNILRGFLNLVFENVVLGSFDMDLIEPASVCLFMLICSDQEEYLKLANKLIVQQQVNDEKFKQRLIDAFQLLTPVSLQLTPNRHSLKTFRKNLETFLVTVKGFLCYK